MTTNQAATKDEPKVTAYSWFVALLCMLTYVVSFISRNVWTVAIPQAAPALNISMAAAGGLVTAYYIGYVASNFFSGIIVDKFGPRISLTLATVLTGAFTLAIPFVNGYSAIFALRVLAGISSGPLFAGVTKMNYGWFDDKRRGVAMGFIMSGPAVGGAIASAGFAPIIQKSGWQPGFIAAGITALVIGAIFLSFAKEKGLAVAHNKQPMTPEQKKADWKEAVAIIVSKNFMLGTVMHFFIVGAGQGIQTWLISYFTKVQGLTLAQAGLIYGAVQFLGLGTGILAGIVTDLLKTRKWMVIPSCVVSFLMLFGLTQSKSIGLLTAMLVVNAIMQAFIGNGNNIMQAERAKSRVAGKVMGVYNALCQLGSVVYPVLTGLILDKSGSYFAVLMTIGCTFLIVGFIGLFVKDTYVHQPKVSEQ